MARGVACGITKSILKGMPESLSPLNEHRHDYVDVNALAAGIEHTRWSLAYWLFDDADDVSHA